MMTIHGSLLRNVITNMVFVQNMVLAIQYTFSPDVEFRCSSNDLQFRQDIFWKGPTLDTGISKAGRSQTNARQMQTMTAVFNPTEDDEPKTSLATWGELFVYSTQKFFPVYGYGAYGSGDRKVTSDDLKKRNNDYYMNAQLSLGVNVSSMMCDDCTETVDLDTLIIANSRSQTRCQLREEKNEENKGSAFEAVTATAACNFNEIVICAAIEKEWFLPDKMYWRFSTIYTRPNMNYFRTKNTEILLRLRFGPRDRKCDACLAELSSDNSAFKENTDSWAIDTNNPNGGRNQCPDDITIGTPTKNWNSGATHVRWIWVETDPYEIRPYYEIDLDELMGFHETPTCIQVISAASCNLDMNQKHGYRLASQDINHKKGKPWKKLNLPTWFWRDDMCYDNIDKDQGGELKWRRLQDSAEIISCNHGTRAVYKNVKNMYGGVATTPIIRCVPIYSLICKNNGDLRELGDCSHFAIWNSCWSASNNDRSPDWLDRLDTFDNCFKAAVLACQTVKMVPEPDSSSDEGKLFWASVCETPCNNNSYWDIPTKDCIKCDILNDETEKWESYKGRTLQCMGAYRGRKDCKGDRYLKQISLSDQSDVRLRESLHATCENCLEGSLPPSHYIDPAEKCGSSWDPVRMKLEFQASTIIACGDDYCDPGQYIDCQKDHVCLQCRCPDCDEGTPNQEFCLIDKNSCNGTKFVNTGGSCISFQSLVCPIDYYYAVPDEGNFVYQENGTLILHYDTDKIMEAYCVKCENPWTCDRTQRWIRCLENNMTKEMAEECEACPVVENSRWESVNKMECVYKCDTNFYDNGTACVDCRIPCDAGYFRQNCLEDAIHHGDCMECKVQTDLGACPHGQFEEVCDGKGYGNILDNNCQNTCHQCNTSSNCADDQEFIICKYRAISDTGVCKNCSAFIDNDGIGIDQSSFENNDGEACQFQCKAGYYKQPYQDSSECVECETTPEGVCGCDGDGDGCDGYGFDACDTAHRTSAPGCFCKPGFYKQHEQDATVDHHVCVECDDFLFASSEDAGRCESCPIGYIGNTKEGSTYCIPCAVNTYKGNDNNVCVECDTGTDGITGATTCQTDCSAGLRAKLLEWTGFVKNHNASVAEWVPWTGAPPNKCSMPGMDENLQICRTGMGFQSIQWKSANAESDTGSDVTNMFHTWSCETCANGLAYSTNFDWIDAFD